MSTDVGNKDEIACPNQIYVNKQCSRNGVKDTEYFAA